MNAVKWHCAAYEYSTYIYLPFTNECAVVSFYQRHHISMANACRNRRSNFFFSKSFVSINLYEFMLGKYASGGCKLDTIPILQGPKTLASAYGRVRMSLSRLSSSMKSTFTHLFAGGKRSHFVLREYSVSRWMENLSFDAHLFSTLNCAQEIRNKPFISHALCASGCSFTDAAQEGRCKVIKKKIDAPINRFEQYTINFYQEKTMHIAA